MAFTAEERKKIILSVAAQEIDQKVCPDIIINWYGHNKELGDYTKYYHPKTGVINSSEPLFAYKQHCMPRKEIRYTYLKYYEEFDLMHTCSIKLDAHRGKEGEIRKWERVNEPHDIEAFMFLDDPKAYDRFGCELHNQGKFYNKDLILMASLNERRWDIDTNAKELYRILKIKGLEKNNKYCFPTGDWRFKTIDGVKYEIRAEYSSWGYHFINFIKSVVPRKVKSSKLDKIQAHNLSAITLEELNALRNTLKTEVTAGERYHMNVYGGKRNKEYEMLYGIFQNLDNGESVIRIVNATKNSKGELHDIHERTRVAISENGDVTVLENSGGSWKITSAFNQYGIIGYGSRKINLIGFEDIEVNKNLKYIKSILDTKVGSDKIMNIVHILRHPIIEKFAKSGYPYIASLLIEEGKVNANIKSYFGIDKLKKNASITEASGLNKFALKNFEEYIRQYKMATMDRTYGVLYPSTLIRIIKVLYPDIDHHTKESVDLIFNQVKTVASCSTYFYSPYSLIYKFLPYSRYRRWGEPEILEEDSLEEARKIIRLLYNFDEKVREGAIRTYLDTVESFRSLDEKPQVDFFQYMKKIEDLVVIHDEIVQLKTIQDQRRRAEYNLEEKKRIELKNKKYIEEIYKEKSAKFDYRPENSEYVIRYPKELSEISLEGVSLGHCVGGYVMSHAEGRTNIMFLRRKDAENVSFYTIEINNNNTVVQIHGNRNRWLGCVPEAVQFVADWLAEKKIKCSKKILLNKGIGYGASKEELDEKDYNFDSKYVY